MTLRMPMIRQGSAAADGTRRPALSARGGPPAVGVSMTLSRLRGRTGSARRR
ncbi:hypothetical protein ACFPM0_11445 [Pseudonocardia sulfidoxydans]|uniref:hypothetical protein n=1 Tax=Pseudonocardia sulfidoxydans TaxID=54011 RepID=UPI003606A700